MLLLLGIYCAMDYARQLVHIIDSQNFMRLIPYVRFTDEEMGMLVKQFTKKIKELVRLVLKSRFV